MDGNGPSDDLEVKTTGGLVRGTRTRGVRTWRGIPYAAAPTGRRRFRAPQPAEPWTGVRDASRFGPVPVQERIGEFVGAGKHTPMDEDCLSVNVVAPEQPGDGPRPVMVWFYGGAYVVGASSVPAYRGDRLVRRGDVVYVSVNYRLGALGYLDFSSWSTPERPFDANLGLRDQVAALQWVRENIAAFGGDPDQVTIFGESAGGTSVTTLMAVPAARGLFQRAIAQSPAPAMVFAAERARDWARDFVDALGGDDPARALEEASTEEILGAAKVLRAGLGATPGTLPSSPVVDGDVLPETPLDAFEGGRAADVPLIIGTNDTEGRLFEMPGLRMDLLRSQASAERMFALAEPEARDRVLSAYDGTAHRRDLGGDYMFWWPAVRVMAAHRGPVYAYRYDLAPPLLHLMGLGATHGLELYPVFGLVDTRAGRRMTALGGRRAMRGVQNRMQHNWLHFARHGEPADHWPAYDADTRLTRIFAATDRVEADPRRDRRLAWEGFRGYR